MMFTKKLIFLSLGVTLITLSFVLFNSFTLLGKKIKGNGKIVSKTYSLAAFKDVHTSGHFDIVLTQNDKSEVVIETDENLFEYLKVEVSGRELNIGTKSNSDMAPTKTMVARVSSKLYQDISLSGSGNIKTENILKSDNAINMSISGSGNANLNLESKSTKVKILGSGDVSCNGKTENVEIHISGSGDVKCENFQSENAIIKISGSGDASVSTSKSIAAKISGSGDIIYYGNPTDVDMKVSGSGSVKKREKATTL